MTADARAADKERRRAEALRANLKRRKAATREVEARRAARTEAPAEALGDQMDFAHGRPSGDESRD